MFAFIFGFCVDLRIVLSHWACFVFVVELIMEFEREFDIQIPDDQAEKISTVGQAVDYITENAK